MSAVWVAVLTTSVGCYLLKLAGLSVPRRLLEQPYVRRAGLLLPVALLAALVVVQTFSTGQRLALDARAAGVAVAGALVLGRAQFIVVVAGAALVTAGLRLL